MNPTQFKNKNYLGIKGLKIVVQNEINAFLRNKGLIISQLIQPILYYIFIVLGINSFVKQIEYEGIKISYADYALTGILGILIISQMTQMIYRITIDKRYGLLALKRQSGISSFYYVVGMSMYSNIGICIQAIVLYIISKIFGSSIDLINYLKGILLLVIVMYFWTSIAALITIKINDYQRRDSVISFIITPLGFTAPAFYLLADVPNFIRILAFINPLTYQLKVIRSIVFQTGTNILLLIILVLLTTIIMMAISSFAISKMSLVLTER